MTTGTPSTVPCQLTVADTIFEQPPTQTAAGANNTMNVGVITLGTPLATGASINIQFLLGIKTTGLFKFFINVEAVP